MSEKIRIFEERKKQAEEYANLKLLSPQRAKELNTDLSDESDSEK